MLPNKGPASDKESTMYINIWSSPLLAGLSRGWCFWFDAMARTQDLSAPWKTDARGSGEHRAAALRRPDIGAYESACATK